jgi:hypothetical protein
MSNFAIHTNKKQIIIKEKTKRGPRGRKGEKGESGIRGPRGQRGPKGNIFTEKTIDKLILRMSDSDVEKKLKEDFYMSKEELIKFLISLKLLI